jgi:hypothetical protein
MKECFGKKKKKSQALVAHACNATQEAEIRRITCSLKLAWANSSQDHILRKPITKKVLVEWPKKKKRKEKQEM